MKKIFSILLVVTLVLSMASTAFAATNYAITVTNNPTVTGVSIINNTYSAYKVFDVTYAADTNGTPTGAYSYTVVDEFAGFTYDGKSGDELINYLRGINDDAAELDLFAKSVLQFIQTNSIANSGTVVAADETTQISVGTPGYYLITGSGANENNETVTAACALTTTNPIAQVNVKIQAPTIDKNIVPANAKGIAGDVGSVVSFEVVTHVPAMTGYSDYTFSVIDTLSNGLTFNDDLVVTLGQNPLQLGRDYKVTIQNNSMKVDFQNFIQHAALEGSEIKLAYSATINENALTTDHETNEVELLYSNNPYSESTASSVPVSTRVYDFNVEIDKYTLNAENKVSLANAKFVLFKFEGSQKLYYKFDQTTNTVKWIPITTETELADAILSNSIAEVTTDNNGHAQFAGVDAGEYWLLETAAPAGYNMLQAPVQVTITASYDNLGDITTNADHDADKYKMVIEVENRTGSILPSTGGIGTTVFYLTGGGLMVAAVVLLLIRKKRSSSESE